jgi:hypothetical protein
MKITYILGAGASANVLPLIKDQANKPGMPTKLNSFIDQFKQEFSELGIASIRPSVRELEEIARLVIKFKTPDLLAKFYLETGDLRNYDILKRLLSKYFVYEESRENETGVTINTENIDPRVIPFLATISRDQKLPDNVKIINWNYDRQIEKAVFQFQSLNRKKKPLSNFISWPTNSKEKADISSYFMLHLNGLAGYNYSEPYFLEREQSEKEFKDADPMISFAWEEDESFGKRTFANNRIQIADAMVRDTNVLVVIGYSFPFFNRNIDSYLFSAMRSCLEKIYFQDPFLDGSFLYNQFNLHKEDITNRVGQLTNKKTDIIHIKEVDNYYVPYEL